MLAMMKRLPKTAVYDRMPSPVGDLFLIASDEGLHAVLWEKDYVEHDYRIVFSKLRKVKNHPILVEAREQLKEYFSGKRKDFDLPLVVDGTTFQKKAWRQLTRIPYGKTLSYEQQAKKLGDAKKARAVGTANSCNPISIVVPCHRVIAKNGTLSGFGGGIENKQYLLELEQRNM